MREMLVTADRVFSPDGWVENGVLWLEPNGVRWASEDEVRNAKKIEHYKGILSPGFVNVHCHLELSALKNKIPIGGGMANFGQHVMMLRNNLTLTETHEAMLKELKMAYEKGTQVMGDICNTLDSFEAKQNFPKMYFHNFVELFGMRPERADTIIEAGKALATAFSKLPNGATSLTLHAPYSISQELMSKAKTLFANHSGIRSVHLLESVAERLIFQEGTGDFLDLYKNIGINFQKFPTQSPIEYLQPCFNAIDEMLFIHLTQANSEDLKYLNNSFPHSYWGLCPRSNFYLHSTYPPISELLEYSDKICLGTDSLASNFDLNLGEEIDSLRSHFPEIDFHLLLKWATYNGAKALKVENQYGSFSEELRPCGLIEILNNHITRLN